MNLLGICIPTYRRPDFLKRCVLSAIESAEGRLIEIYISDDSISDINSAVIDELQKDHACVHVHRNTVNMGIDDNIQQVVAFCQSKYAWLIGEDDTFLPGAVARMHDLLLQRNDAFLFSNYLFVGNDPSKPVSDPLLNVQDGVFSADDFLKHHLWAVGFIGSCVVRRDEWELTIPEPYEGTYYTHVGRIAEIISRARTAYVSNAPGVANRVEGGGAETFTWWGDSYGVFFGFVRMCRAAQKRCSQDENALKIAGDDFERKFLTYRLAVRLRAELSYNHQQFKKYISPHSTLPALKKFLLKLISLTPPQLFQPIVMIHRATRKWR